MGSSMPAAKTPPPAEPLPQAQYPQLEAYIERASADEVRALFDPLKTSLATVKGPKSEQAKKVVKAVERTEELLHHLFEVRGRLEQERGGKKPKR